jgi:predicted metal-dependent TIM-barrel fold hydrolase
MHWFEEVQMKIIEPHIHMYSRTTDDYVRMYQAGIRACVEPSFWLGSNRRYAGTFFDYFRFSIHHYAAISLTPKEAEDAQLAKDVIAGLGEYLSHPRCVAMGEIGFNNITPNEEQALVRQLHIAEERKMPVIIHLPHVNKLQGIKRTIEIIKAEGCTRERIILDHNTEETIQLALASGCYAGMTVYPISKLTPERVSAMIKEHGSKRVIVNGSADWGISDPLSLVKVVDYLAKDGHDQKVIEDLTFNNAMDFYRHSPNWKPRFDIVPLDPHTFQR